MSQVNTDMQLLSESEERFRSLFDYNPDIIFIFSREGIIVDVNRAIDRFGPAARETLLGHHVRNFFAPDEGNRQVAYLERALAGETLFYHTRARTLDGHELDVAITTVPIYRNGRVDGAFSIVRDESDQRTAERRIELQEREASLQRERIRDLYFIAASAEHADVRVRASLQAGCRAFNLTIGAIVETSGETPRIDAIFRDANEPTGGEERLLALAQAAALQETLAPVVRPDGVALRLDVGGAAFGALVFAGADHPLTFSETDADLLGLITTLVAGAIDRSRQRARMRAMAYYDALTNLPNRAFLGEKLRDAIEVAQSRMRRVAVLLLDLDRFKDVNDTLGHAHGDRLLQLVAERLRRELGERATIARTGGDEFVVVLTDCNEADTVRDVAEHIIGVISEPYVIDEFEPFISTSIGIAVYPEDGRDDQTLVKNADIAMYRAKDRGRNGYYFYNPTLESPIHMRLSQEKLLRRALELGEFEVYYQPQLDVRTNAIVSVEALVRWNHPKSGLIEPSHFIPSAEISGLIVPLGHWVLTAAAEQTRRWHDTLGPIRLAVNLSGRQFHQRDLRRTVLAVLRDTHFDPTALEIEITESVAMSDAAQTVAIVRDLKAAGIRIALDDFGTGYSSLAYLRRFALDALKIDASFVSGIGRESFDETIVNTVIGMAHSLGLEVVAEGVETPEQLEFLTTHRCDLVQGFTISRPLSARDLEAFVQRHREAATASGKVIRR